MKNVCRWLLVLLAAGLLLFSLDKPVVLAQSDNDTIGQSENETIGFKDVTLWLYPEYDDPRLLVMLEGQIEGTEAPVELSFLVPSAAEMYAAGSMDAQGNYSGGPPDREPSTIPGWDKISYEVTDDTFRVEYYDPIIRGDPDKTIDYQFRWLYPISGLGIIIQEPLKSTNFSVIPRGNSFTDEQGYASHGYSYAELTEIETLGFDIVYTKTELGTSLSLSDQGGASTDTLLVVVVVAIVAAAIIGGLLWLTRVKRQEKTRGRQPAGKKRAGGSGDKSAGGQFCVNCGQRLEKSAKFCSNCGTRVS